MPRHQALQRKADHIRDCLETLDSRFTLKPQAHRFTKEIKAGAQSLPGLTEILINENEELETRLDCLEALGVILKSNPASKELSFYLEK